MPPMLKKWLPFFLLLMVAFVAGAFCAHTWRWLNEAVTKARQWFHTNPAGTASLP